MDQITVQPAVTPEDPAYVAEMAAKGEQAVNSGNTHNEPVSVDPKPDFVPEKFYDPATGKVDYEALAKSYQELEKQRSKPQDPPKVEQPPKQSDEAPSQEDAATEAVKTAGLDMNVLQQEYAANGELSEASYEALAKAGIPKETVDDYIAGRQAFVEQIRSHAFTLTEGEDNYNAMVGWAKANLSVEEIKEFNKQVNTRTAGIRETAIRGLYSRYVADVGADGNLAAGKASTTGNVQGYQSRQQMMADMNDPRYKSDPAFRQQVINKLSVSSVF